MTITVNFEVEFDEKKLNLSQEIEDSVKWVLANKDELDRIISAEILDTLEYYVQDNVDLEQHIYNYVEDFINRKLDRIKEKFSTLKFEINV